MLNMQEITLSINLPAIILISITLLAIGACFFLIGYLCGSRRSGGVYITEKQSSFLSDQGNKKAINNITIDDTKIVTKINTDNLEKKYNSLGDKKESEENIGESVNKLKNLKR